MTDDKLVVIGTTLHFLIYDGKLNLFHYDNLDTVVCV